MTASSDAERIFRDAVDNVVTPALVPPFRGPIWQDAGATLRATYLLRNLGIEWDLDRDGAFCSVVRLKNGHVPETKYLDSGERPDRRYLMTLIAARGASRSDLKLRLAKGREPSGNVRELIEHETRLLQRFGKDILGDEAQAFDKAFALGASRL